MLPYKNVAYSKQAYNSTRKLEFWRLVFWLGLFAGSLKSPFPRKQEFNKKMKNMIFYCAGATESENFPGFRLMLTASLLEFRH
jgi:hypothetical protein